MSRPINADSARTRARVLEVAIRHFGRDGFKAATLRQIGADAGITFATIHHHFGTKSDLFAACVESAFAELRQIGLAVVAVLADPPASTRVERAVRHAFRAAADNGDRSRFLLRTFVFEDKALVGAHLESYRSQFLEGALGALARGFDGNADELRIRFIGFGMLVTRLAAASSFELDALSDKAFVPGGVVESYLIDVANATLVPTLPETFQ